MALNFEERLPQIKALVDRLLRFSSQLSDRNLTVEFERDHFGFMMLAFASKQEEHLQSIRILIDQGRDRDAALLGRTMIEGLALLIWATQDPDKRAVLWRGYAYVADWRTAQALAAQGNPPDESQQRSIESFLSQNREKYHSGKAKEALRKNKALPADPFRHQWYDVDIASVFRAAKLEDVYETMYRDTSGWIHWNIAPIARAISFGELRVTYHSSDPRSAFVALIAGFDCLLMTFKLMDQHFGLEIAGDLAKVEQEYKDILPPTPSQSGR